MNRGVLRVRDYLSHMLDAVRQIQSYTRGKSIDDFYADRLLQDAVIRNFEILGEAAKKLLDAVPDAAARFAAIPLVAIYAMRNQLAHGYFSIDLDVVWKVIERDLPELSKHLETAIANWDKEAGE